MVSSGCKTSVPSDGAFAMENNHDMDTKVSISANGLTDNEDFDVVDAWTTSSTTCLYCRSPRSIRTEWSQGDRVCTSCGIVHAQHIMATGPEWRDYGDKEDGGGNGNNKARSGLVPMDESKYLGGLQPTLVSKYLFGSSAGSSSARAASRGMAQRLLKANRRIDKLMEMRHKAAFADANVNLKILKKRQTEQQERRSQNQGQVLSKDPHQQTDTDTVNTDTVATVDDDIEPDYGSNVVWMEERPELEQQILEQEENLNRHRLALNADKWSLDRAKQWCGGNTNGAATESSIMDHQQNPVDPVFLTAARDIYTCYQTISQASISLHLPIHITDEATSLLCQYASRRDGLKVKGVATTVSSSSSSSSLSAKRSTTKTESHLRSKRFLGQRFNSAANAASVQSFKELHRMQQIRDANKLRQMGALCAALLFWTARHRQHPRSLVAVCDSVSGTEKVQRKHCSRAMNDLKEHFPELNNYFSTLDASMRTDATMAQSSRNNQTSSTVPNAISVTAVNVENRAAVDVGLVTNMTEHSLRKLALPPVAGACVRCLVFHYLNSHSESVCSTPVLTTVCAAVAFFVSQVGSTMQQLASQTTVKTTKRSSGNSWTTAESKKVKLSSSPVEITDCSFDLFDDAMSGESDAGPSSSLVLAEQRAYEMRRMWDAWSVQLPWSRTLASIEESTGIATNKIWDCFKQKLFPQRSLLLLLLQNALMDPDHATNAEEQRMSTFSMRMREEICMLRGTPLASVLLPYITVAVPLMKADSKL